MNNDDYWGANMIVDSVWVGSFTSSLNEAPLKEHGITHIINCTRELPCRFPTQFNYLHIKLIDQTHQNIISTFHNAIDFINEGLNKGGSILIHCGNGSSRSGSIIIAFLLSRIKNTEKHNQKSVDEIITYAQTKRSKIQPNPGFLEQLNLFVQWNYTLPDDPNPEQLKILSKYRLKAEILKI